MENASYALKIAGATLLGVLIIALAVYGYGRIREYQKSKDETVSRSSISEFNKAFELYDKSLMYGTDVLSCLNKAQNNNQEYVYSYYSNKDSIDTFQQRANMLLQVTVTIKTTIQEKINVYYKSNGVQKLALPSDMKDFSGSGAITFSSGAKHDYWDYQPFDQSRTPHFDIPTISYYYFTSDATDGGSGTWSRGLSAETKPYSEVMWKAGSGLGASWYLRPASFDTIMKNGEYKLYGESGSADGKKTSQLIALLSNASKTEQTIRNKDFSGDGLANWYSATWRTGAYDFKTRKFKCTSMEYSEETGFVNKISFEEVTSADY